MSHSCQTHAGSRGEGTAWSLPAGTVEGAGCRGGVASQKGPSKREVLRVLGEGREIQRLQVGGGARLSQKQEQEAEMSQKRIPQEWPLLEPRLMIQACSGSYSRGWGFRVQGLCGPFYEVLCQNKNEEKGLEM